MNTLKVLKIITLVSTGGLMMGNQSCQKSASTRTYKKIVEMGMIDAQDIELPDGKKFNFKFVANQQMYGVVADSQQFALRLSPPIVSDPSQAESGTSVADNQAFNLSKADQELFQKSLDASQKALQGFSTDAWCMVNMPQAKLYGSVNSFEAIGGGGLSLGYTPAGAAAGGTIAFNVEKAQLDVSMRAMPALGNTLLAASNVDAKQTKFDIKADINFGLFSFGPSYYYSTPLATATKKGLTKALDQLSERMTSDTWYSRVFADLDNVVILVGGRDVGYQEGDQLDVYNEQYIWEGEPCNSAYVGSIGTGESSYYGRVEIISVGDQLSQAKVVTIDPNSTQGFASVGAKVKIYKMKEELAAAK